MRDTSVTTLYPASGTGIKTVPLKSVAKENQFLLEYPLTLSQRVYITFLFNRFTVSRGKTREEKLAVHKVLLHPQSKYTYSDLRCYL